MSENHVSENKGKRRSRKVRAMLAGGLVLGVGAVMTLAVWNDSVFVNGVFATGSWNIQGNVDPALGVPGWQEYDTSPGGSLAFEVEAADLTPGDTVYAPVALRVDPDNDSYDGLVTLEGAVLTGDLALGNALVYEAKTDVAAAECNATDFAAAGDELVPPLSPLDTGSAPTDFTVLKTSVPVPVCFAVTLPATATATVQGMTTTAVWEFAAESVAP